MEAITLLLEIWFHGRSSAECRGVLACFGMGHRIGEVRPCAVSPAWIRTDKRTSCDFAGRSIMGLELWSKF